MDGRRQETRERGNLLGLYLPIYLYRLYAYGYDYCEIIGLGSQFM
jgi:hypothetical protein